MTVEGLLRVVFAGLVAGLLAGCGSLPPLDGRTVSSALDDASGTQLHAAIEPLVRAHPGRSGVAALQAGHDAFAARMRLAEAAQRTLDVQYYIWHPDLSGTLMFDALQRAANRGVRVRLLLDDNNTAGLDATLAMLDAHPQIEVRLFNPFVGRRWRALGYLGDFGRLNRRMHNKSFTADNQATIIGGRNIGDAYFDVGGDLLFVDLDVLAIGPIAQAVSADFDRYWASASAYPVSRLLPPADPQAPVAFAAKVASLQQTPAARTYAEAVSKSPFVRDLLARRLAFDWCEVRMVSDDPAKGLGQAADDDLLWARLKRSVVQPQRHLALVSPYFVPGADGVKAFTEMAARGVEVEILTNSLAASDVPAVHSGYAKHRRALLEGGVALYEMRRDPEAAEPAAERAGSSSGASLHAKTFAIDGEHLFVGSFNFDPRSARLNTELGFVIDSPALTRMMIDALRRGIASRAYRLRLGADGALEWVEGTGSAEIVHRREPDSSAWLLFGVDLLSLLPIEWLL